MPRRGFIPKREVLPDPVYGTTVVTKLINQIMLDGKRGTAQRICYSAFDTIKEKTGKDATEVFTAALGNVSPQLEVKARRVGGATYQVPIEIRPERRQTLALRWLVEFSRKRGEKTMAERLAAGPGSKTYGILSVLLQAWYEVEYLFTVSEKVFDPPPKVKSAVIRMVRNNRKSLGCDEKLFKTVVKTSFNQRRKTLRNSMKPLLGKDCPDYPLPIFDKRPEQLSVEQFVELTLITERNLNDL